MVEGSSNKNEEQVSYCRILLGILAAPFAFFLVALCFSWTYVVFFDWNLIHPALWVLFGIALFRFTKRQQRSRPWCCCFRRRRDVRLQANRRASMNEDFENVVKIVTNAFKNDEEDDDEEEEFIMEYYEPLASAPFDSLFTEPLSVEVKEDLILDVKTQDLVVRNPNNTKLWEPSLLSFAVAATDEEDQANKQMVVPLAAGKRTVSAKTGGLYTISQGLLSKRSGRAYWVEESPQRKLVVSGQFFAPDGRIFAGEWVSSTGARGRYESIRSSYDEEESSSLRRHHHHEEEAVLLSVLEMAVPLGAPAP